MHAELASVAWGLEQKIDLPMISNNLKIDSIRIQFSRKSFVYV